MMSSENDLEETPIQKFYAATKIFITGGTGLLGQILIEKLLRSCPSISTIYILVRNKKDKTIQTRVEDLFNGELFDTVRKKCPTFREKIIPVAGDCTLEDIGLTMSDKEMLIKNVHIVFHAAATVRFDEKLQTAVHQNVRAVRDLMRLCKQMQNLKATIHISTAYANCVQDVIEEKIYEPTISGNGLIKLTDSVTDDLLDKLAPTIIGKWPNSYAFTKCIAEDVVRTEAADMPAAIFRPAIVISSYKEPLPGWINNYYGPTGFVSGVAMGLIRVANVDRDKNANLVPVDMCVNAMITAAWEVDDEYQKCKKTAQAFETPVYNYVSSNDSPLQWSRFVDQNIKTGFDLPYNKAVWCLSVTLHKYFLPYFISVLFLHFLPAVIIDFGLWCGNKKPRAVKVYKKIYKFCNVLSYFTTRDWKFESGRVTALVDKLTQKDQDIFYSDLRKLDWDNYFINYTKGIRMYLVKDPLDTLPAARARVAKFYYLQQTIKSILLFFVIRLIW